MTTGGHLTCGSSAFLACERAASSHDLLESRDFTAFVSKCHHGSRSRRGLSVAPSVAFPGEAGPPNELAEASKQWSRHAAMASTRASRHAAYAAAQAAEAAKLARSAINGALLMNPSLRTLLKTEFL
mmetsp:Transcript_50496/g.134277  ORF Transcript_50496/g.134277 Transcript_50496/m.134277 type:complete len:127 (-) Transcript_50496:213-593(-)